MAKPSANQATISRLPSTRESRPALIGLAVLLIFGGALASAWLAIQSGNRSYFVQIDQEVAQGATISKDDLARVSLPEGFKGGIPSSDSDSVVGKSAAARLLPGTVLMRSMVSGKSGVGENQTRLTVTVDASPFISGLQSGDQLALDVGSSDGGQRQTVYAELISVGDEQGSSIGGSGGDEIAIVVSIDLSCLSVVSQGIEDRSVTPALIGGTDNNSLVQRTCGA
jgi:hypothetical protein